MTTQMKAVIMVNDERPACGKRVSAWTVRRRGGCRSGKNMADFSL